MKIRNRTGLLGGTFNPIHKGHIELGIKTIEKFDLDRIFYILSAHPPHKQGSNVVPAKIRWKMLGVSLQQFPELIPCDIELKRENYSWTIDTVLTLKKIYPNEKLYFISGSEGFLKIKTWKSYKELLNTLNFIIAVREKEEKKKVIELLKSEKIRYFVNGEKETSIPSVNIFSYNSPTISISSTMIRERVRKGFSIDNLVSNKVKDIIMELKLYD